MTCNVEERDGGEKRLALRDLVLQHEQRVLPLVDAEDDGDGHREDEDVADADKGDEEDRAGGGVAPDAAALEGLPH